MSTYGNMTMQRWLSTLAGRSLIKLLIALLVLQPCLEVGQRAHWDPVSLWRMLSWPLDLVRPDAAQATSPVADAGATTLDSPPCFPLTAKVKAGKVQLDWPGQSRHALYTIYRAEAVAPSTFAKLAETTAAFSTYLDERVRSERTYLYIVGAVVPGMQCFSAVASAHPTTRRGPGNYAPVIYSTPITHGTTESTYTYDVNATDPNGDVLRYFLKTRPAGMTVEPATGLISWTPTHDGTFKVTVVVDDAHGATATQSYVITVKRGSASNHPPVAHAGRAQTVMVGAIVTLNGSGSTDVDCDPLTYMWSLSQVPTGSKAVLSNPTAVKPTFKVDKPGTYEAQLIVNDGKADSDPDTVAISTHSSPPVARAGPDQTVFVGDTVTLDGSGSTDVDGDTLAYRWTLMHVPAGSGAGLSDPMAVKPTFRVDKPGTYEAQLIVNDGRGDSTPDTVTISTQNSAPVARAGPDQTVQMGATVTLDGRGSSDVDGNTLTFRWALTALPPGSTAALSDQMAVMPTFVVDIPGHYVGQLIVNDGTVASAADTVSISTQNSPPVARAGPEQSVQVGDTVTLDGRQSHDVDGNPLTYRWAFTARPAASQATLAGSTTVRPTFVVDEPGTYVVQLIVNDGTVDSVPATVTIVTHNSAPVAHAGPDQSVFVGDIVTLDGSASRDADHDPLTYQWSFTAVPIDSAAVLATPTTVEPTFVVDEPGTYVAQLIVNDGTVPSPPDAVVISTQNSRPVARAGPDQTVAVGDTVSLDGSASHDADHDPLHYRWSLLTVPTGSTAALSDTAAVTPSFTVNAPDTYIAQLIVDDTHVDSVPDTVTITANLTTLLVPNVVGLAQAAAQTALVSATLTVGTLTSMRSATVPAGQVISQQPVAGTSVAPGAAVALVLSLGDVNTAPAITSAPVASAAEGQPYRYDVAATDADGDLLTFALTVAPDGMSIGPVMGTVTWTPSAADIGTRLVTVQVADGRGGFAAQHFAITVAGVNHPPQITSVPVTMAVAGQPYHYAVAATDQDAGDVLTFALTTAPTGMSLNTATGLIQWTPSDAQVGNVPVVVTVSDGKGGAAPQQYQVTVLARDVDLAVAAVDASGVTTETQALVIGGTVRVDIRNASGSPFTGSAEVLVFEDRNHNGTFENSVDNVVGTGTFAGSIASQAVAALDVRVSGVLAFRDDVFYAVVDSTHQLPGGDTSNDIGHTISLYHPPVGVFQPKVKWERDVTTALGVFHPPVVAPLVDTNGDGLIDARDIPAVIVVSPGPSTHTSTLTVWRGDTGTDLFPPVELEALAIFTPAVGDLDGDGKPEIIVTESRRLACFNNDGTLKWRSPDGGYVSNPMIADLDGDGKAEILSGTAVFNVDGTLRWDIFVAPAYIGGWDEGQARQVADLDLDGTTKIVAGPSVMDKDGNVIWYWASRGSSAPFTTTGTLDRGATTITLTTDINVGDAFTAVANLDNDPYPEILALFSAFTGMNDAALWIFAHDGRIKARFTLFTHTPQTHYQLGPPTVVDIDGDGQPEIIVPMLVLDQCANNTGGCNSIRLLVHRYHSDGTLPLLWQKDLSAPDNNVVAPWPVSAFDFDGDGAAELVYLDDQKLYIFNGRDGTTLFEFGVNRTVGDASTLRYPTIADVGNDGVAEIIVPTEVNQPAGAPPRHGVLVVGDVQGNWRPARRIWNQSHYNLTNINEDGSVPQVPLNNWQVFNNLRTQATPDGVEPFGAPDLTASKVTIATQHCPASLDITARIGNGGSLHAPAGISVNFYNGDPAAGGTLFGMRQTTRTLYPGAFEDVTLAWGGIAPGQVFVTVNELRPGSPIPSGNLALLPDTWAQSSGRCQSSVPYNTNAYAGIDGKPLSGWLECISTTPSFYEVRFPFPVNATAVTIQNSLGASTNAGFLAGTLTFSNGFSLALPLNANGEGTLAFPEQQDISWVRLTASAKPGGASLSEFIVAGSYSEPKFRINEGEGRSANNLAASAPGIPACGTTTNQPPLITSAPLITAHEGSAYLYAVQTFDPNNDPLTFTLVTMPAGMAIDSTTGLMQWTPTSGQAGDHAVAVRVQDPGGLFATQSFTIAVAALPATVTAPSMVGLTQPQAEAALSAAHLTLGSIATATSATVPAGTVLSQNPPAGTLVAQGTTVNLVVSLGASGATVPNLAGLTRTQAEQSLAVAGLTLGSITTAGSPTVPIGSVISQTPTVGTLLTPGTAVALVVSVGANATTAPTLAGLTRVQAEAALATAHLTPGTITLATSVTVPAGSIISQNPPVGTALVPGTSVSAVVSVGPTMEVDADSDGFTVSQGDCNDTNPNIYPGAFDIPGNGIDEDCNGADAVAGDTIPPVASYTSPPPDAVILLPTDIVGTVNDANFLRYTLSLARVNDTTFVPFATGTQPVVNGVLGRLAPTLLENGMHRVRLTVEDVNGQVSSTDTIVLVQGGAKVGIVRLSFVDLNIPVLGIPITVTRIYDSRVKTQRDFGVGWSLGIKAGSYEHNRDPGEGWTVTKAPGPFGFACKVVNETLSHFTEIRLSDRESYTFRLALFNTAATVGGCLAEARFEFVDGWLPGATLEILDNTGVVYQSGTNEVLDDNTFTTYNPAQVRLTTLDGRTIDLDRTTGITRLQDRNGNSLSFTSGGIVHSTGKSVSFTRDAQGRITSIIDPMGNTIQYEYDSVNDLIHVTNQVGAVTTFAYSTTILHHLERIINPDGQEVTKFAYDMEGRMARSCDGQNHCIAMGHDLLHRRESMVDPTGRQTTYTYDARGNVLSQTDGLGHTISFKYDHDGNLIQNTNASGGVTTYTYDTHRNRLAVTKPHAAHEPAADFTTTYTYNARDQLTSITLPTRAQLQMTYDTDGNRLALLDETGNILASNAYGLGGIVTRESDSFGTTTRTYDTAGNPVQRTDPFGDTTTMTYDVVGRLKSMTDKRGVTATFEYDSLGRETFVDFGDDISVAYSYGFGRDWITLDAPTIGHLERQFTANGQLEGLVGPDGPAVTLVYDSAGRLAEEIPSLGSSRQYHYDMAGRLESITEDSGAKVSMAYDPAGQLMTQTDPLGNTTGLTYFPDGRLASKTNARGQSWTYSYTPTTVRVRDPLSRETTFVQSPHGLLMEIIHPDGTTRRVNYLLTSPLQGAENFPTSLTDEGGHVRNYIYNSSGQLITATDLGGAVYTYHYDPVRLMSVVGPTSETFSFSYNGLGQLQTITYPDSTVKSITYGPNRLPAPITLPSKTTVTYEYDAAGRQIARRSSLGEESHFVWNANSALTSVQDPIGTTQYLYDVRGELRGIDYPSGARIRYKRDLLHRVVEMMAQTSFGSIELITKYAYDAVGNLVSVVDPLGGETTLVYDAVNRLVMRMLPNGITTSYTYDELDRVITVVHQKSDGTVLASVAYERQGIGEPTRVIREDGSFVLLGYDAALRLTSEAYYDASGTLLEQISYTYDATGNRLMQSNATGSHTYIYQPGFQLTRVQGPSGDESYGYDIDGRITSIARDGATLGLSYDTADRLTIVENQTNGTHVEYTHDGVGHRVRTLNASGEHRFLVAPTLRNGLESVHLVVNNAGDLAAGYVYAGEHPLMRFDSTGPTYYLTDAMGSVIALADGAAASVAKFAYDGFGNLRASSGQTSASSLGVNGDFRFHGGWLESTTGLYHFRARDYDPRVGRFLSRDPAEPVYTQPESLHPYAFANSNPYLFRDPTGLFTLIELNISVSSQSIIQTARGYAINSAADFFKDKAKGALGNLFLGAFRYLVPGEEAYAILDLYKQDDQGNLLDRFLAHEVCKMFEGNNHFDWIWIAPEISADGEPKNDNALDCRHVSRLVSLVRDAPNPDFLFKQGPPKSTDKKPKAWLIGDIKLHVRSIRDKVYGKNPAQWYAIANYAKYKNGHQYLPFTFFITWSLGNTSPDTIADLQLAAFAQQVVMYIFVIAD